MSLGEGRSSTLTLSPRGAMNYLVTWRSVRGLRRIVA